MGTVKTAPLCAALVMIAVTCWSPPASAFECKHSKLGCWVSLHWPQRRISYVVRGPASLATEHPEYFVAIRAAAKAWNQVPCSDMVLEYGGFIPIEETSTALNQVWLVTSGWTSIHGHKPNEVGVTNNNHHPQGELKYGRIDLNAENFEFRDASTSCLDGNEIDLQSVMTHEFGHFLGIAHPCGLPEDAVDQGVEFLSYEEAQAEGTEESAEPPALSCPIIQCTDFELDNPLMQSLADRPTMWPIAFESCDDVVFSATEALYVVHQRTLEADDASALCHIYPASSEEPRSCEPLPENFSVSNEAFGCASTAGSNSSSTPFLFSIFVFLALLVRRR